jgi:hypothetical protein
MGPEHGSGRHEVEALERIRVSGLLEWDGGSDFEAEALGMGSVMIFCSTLLSRNRGRRERA